MPAPSRLFSALAALTAIVAVVAGWRFIACKPS
jgi:hypothetical protein